MSLSKLLSQNKGIFTRLAVLALILSILSTSFFAAHSLFANALKASHNAANIADMSITGTYGISDLEKGVLEKVSGLKDIEYSYFVDATTKTGDLNCRIFSKPDTVSKFTVLEGVLPQKENEIAVSEALAEKFGIGSSVKFIETLYENQKPELSNTYFTVVGIVSSTEATDDDACGTSAIGDIKCFAVATKDVFTAENFTLAKLTFSDVAGVDPLSKDYAEKMAAHEKEVKAALDSVADEAFENGKAADLKNVNEINDRLNNAVNDLNNEQGALNNEQNKLSGTKSALNDKDTSLIKQKGENDQTSTKLATIREKYNEELNAYTSKANDYASKDKGYEYAMTKLNAEYDKLANDREILENTRENMKAQFGEESSNYEDFMSGKYATQTAAFADTQAALDQRLADLDKTREELDNEKAELDAAKAELDKTAADLQKALDELDGAVVNRNDNRENYNIDNDAYKDNDRIHGINKENFDREKPAKDENIKDLQRQAKGATDRNEGLQSTVYKIASRGHVYMKDMAEKPFDSLYGEGYGFYAKFMRTLKILSFVFLFIALIILGTCAYLMAKRLATKEGIGVKKTVPAVALISCIGALVGALITILVW